MNNTQKIIFNLLLIIGLLVPKLCMAAFVSSTQTGTAFDTVTGVPTWPTGSADDGAEVVNIGFTFDFQGTSYTQVRLITNGALHFGANQNFHTQFTNTTLAAGTADRLIMPLWDDLNPGAGGAVTFGTLGTAPNRRFVAHWNQVERWNNAAATCSFQAVLFEGSNDIHFRYDPTDTGTNCDGRSATIGAEATDSNFDQFSFNSAINLNLDIVYTQSIALVNAIADWRMDELSWNGTANEVVDSSGSNFHGTANPGTTTTSGYLCNAADLSASSATDYMSMNNAALDGRTDFTVSFWGKTANTGNNSPISGFGSSGDDAQIWFSNDTTFQPWIASANQGSIGIPSIADDQWHHWVWTRSGTAHCFYTDGVQDGCVTGSVSAATSVFAGSLIIGQELDCAGNCFSAAQDWDGLIDEMLIFDQALTPAQVAVGHTNQLALNNWDGTARTCPGTTMRMEVAEITLNDTAVTPSFTSVTFKQTYTVVPLVFILPSNEGGADPASIRIQNVTTSGFQVSQVEPETQDGPHSAMTVHYLVIEPGVHQLPDGRTIEAGTHSTASVQHGTGVSGGEAWDTVNFTTTFSSQASVLAGIQGMVNESNNPPTTTSIPWLVPAVRNVGTGSVQLALGRGEVNDGGTLGSNESIGYVAIEGNVQGSFASGSATILYESIVSADNIAGWNTENCPGNVGQAVNFVNTYSVNPLVMGNISKHDGGDGGWIRRCSLTTAQIGVAVDEDQFRDTERNHTNEAANFLVFSQAFCLPIACVVSPVDHYKISFPKGNTGLTCEPSLVEITAHDVADLPINVPTGTILNISTSTGTGDWGPAGPAPLVGTGTWTPSGANDGVATYTWPGAESSFQVDLSQSSAATLNVNLLDSAGISESTLVAAEDPNITFSARGLRFTETGASADDIINQISGKDNNQAPGQTIYLQIVRTTGGSCSPPPGGGVTTRTVQLAAECINPSVCELGSGGPGLAVSVEDNTSTFIPVGVNDFSGGAPTNYVNVSMDFSNVTGLSVNPFVFNYPDAGEIVIHAIMNIGPFTLPGASNNFVVRPFGFDVQLTGNPAATGPGGTKFTEAGEDFTVTARAVAWNSAGDSNNDGVPDNHDDTDPSNNVDLSNTTAYPSTPNFGQEGTNEATDEDIDLSALLDQPSGVGVNDPGLSGGMSITTIVGGSGNSTTVNYDEVGIIEVSAGVAIDNDYLGAGAVIGKSGYVGRFVPYVFEAITNTPEFGPACGTFSYIGQGFTYATVPIINLTAKAKGTAPAFGTTTQNYTGTFLKLTDAKLLAGGNKTYAAASGTLDTSLLPSPDPVIADTGSGTATLTFSDGGGITFNRGNPQDPFDADIALSINVLDTDDVFAGNGSGVNQNPVSFGTATAGNGIAFTGGNKEQRWGRLALDNAFGSELLPLEIPVRTEYQSSGDFITNTDDSCTPYTSANISFSNHNGITAGANLTATGAGTLISGVDDDVNPLVLSNTLQEIGFVDVAHTIDFWLQYDWDNDTNHDNNPGSRATWGIFAGPDEFIYIREPW
jgi:MSHA biogenesis protein MshQ